jgi:glycosyltransferase involved in cell wall biosynthesis
VLNSFNSLYLIRFPVLDKSCSMMKGSSPLLNNANSLKYIKQKILVLLYRDFDYDGRAQRLVHVLKTFGDVTVLDVSSLNISERNREFNHKRFLLNPKWGIFLTHLHFWLTCMRIANKLQPNVVVALNYFTVFPGFLAARKSERRLLYDAYELIIPEPGYYMSFRDRIWYWFERLSIHRANGVIAANVFRADKMQEHYCLPATPVAVRNIPAAKSYSHPDVNIVSIVREGETRVLYQGDMHLSRGLGRFIESLTHLPENTRLIMAGGGADLERIQKLINDLALNARVSLLGAVPHVNMHKISCCCHIGIVTYSYCDLNNIYCSPNKIFEYLQAGLPVVTTDQPPLRQMVVDYGIGEIIRQQDDPKAIAQTIYYVAENINIYKQNIPRFLNDNKWEDEEAKLKLVCNSVIKTANNT